MAQALGRCPVAGCGVPVNVHLQCWSCRRLGGPGHVYERPAGLGLCLACWRRLGRAQGDDAAPDDDLVGTTEAAKLARVSVPTIHRWTREGKLRGERLPGGRLRYRRADVITNDHE